MRDNRSGNSSGASHTHVRHCFGPRNTVLNRVGECNGWVQMCAGDQPKRQNESDQSRASRNRIRKQSNGEVSTRQPFAMMPEPITAATRNALPRNSAVSLARTLNFIDAQKGEEAVAGGVASPALGEWRGV
jgi:hypothetical protein